MNYYQLDKRNFLKPTTTEKTKPMAIRPEALLYRCSACEWQTIFAPTSDAFVQSPPVTCQQCGKNELLVSSASSFNKLNVWLHDLFNS